MKRLLILLFFLPLALQGQVIPFDQDWKFSLGHTDPARDFGRGTEYFTYLAKAASIHNEGPYAVDFDDSAWQEVTLPHDWVVDLPFAPEASKSHGYKTVGWKYPQCSVGWYRKHFTVPVTDQPVYVRFDGIFRDSNLWVNGFWLGGEPSGYAPQRYAITEYLNPGGDNVICVRADASFEEGWFYEGGGIYRHAYLEIGEPAPKPMPQRVITTDPDQGILIDGKRIQLRGVNLHQDHPGVGTAIPDELWVWKIMQLKKLGVNAIRTSHNPASEVFLNICDSLGMYVLEETRLMGVNPAQLQPLRKMIERDKHHPCIILWGIGNEEWGIEWNAKGEAIAAAMTEFVHALDPTRPVVVATSGGPEVVKGADVAGYNYILQNPIEEHRARYPRRIALGTEETTGCGTRGVYFPDKEKALTPALNRAPQGPDSLLNCIGRGMKFYEERPWLGGFFWWTGFDYRGEPDPLVWPATGSEFGLLDYCGFPKDEAYYVQSWWTEEPVLHILPHWALEGHEGEEIPVWVYSNCDEVALFVNGKSLGRKQMQKYGYLEWKVPYKPGRLVAKGYRNGRLVLTETVVTAGAPAALQVQAETIGRLSIVNVAVVDAEGHFCPTACVPVTLSAEGRILGGGNGDPAFKAAERPAPGAHSFTLPSFNGRVQFLVEGASPGRVDVKMSAEATALSTRP